MQKWFGYLLLFLCTIPGTAQVYNVTRYSTEDGLVQSQVMALLQDRFGYLWLGTHRGVCRFDGQSFKAFGTEEGLGSVFLVDIVEGANDTLWMATPNGLSRWDRSRERFKTYTTDDGLSSNDLSALLFDAEGRLWIGTQNAGISLYQGGRFDANPYAWPDSGEHHVTSLMQDGGGKIWIGTLEGLYTWEAESDRLTKHSLPATNDQIEVLSFLEDRRTRNLWVGTTHGIFELKDSEISWYKLDAENLPDQEVFCMVQDEKDQIWIGTREGLIRYDGSSFTHLKRQDQLLNFHMTSSLMDMEGNLWFGTDGGGVRRISEGVFFSLGMEDGLSSNIAKSFLEDEQGRVWISTRDRGINIIPNEGQLVGRDVLQWKVDNSGLGGNNIVSSFRDEEGAFWFASFNGTLTRYRNGQWKVYNESHGLNTEAVYWVTQDGNGTHWVGTKDGIFQKKGERFEKKWSQENGLMGNTIYNLYFDRKQRLWIGAASGLMRIEGDEILQWRGDAVIGENVLTIIEDEMGRIWVGSSGGLFYFDGKDEPTSVRISGAAGAQTVVGLVTEGSQWLWAATENGAYRLNLYDFAKNPRTRFEHYAQKDGLPSLECNANAILCDSQGGVWIGTAEGAILRPKGAEQRRDEMDPLVYLTGVESSVDTTWEAMGFAVDEFGLPENLVLPYTSNRVEFSFIGISLRSPKQVEYKYMMEGVDDTWSSSTRQTRVPYLNLDPGEYTFKVTAKRESEGWDYENPAEFTFRITPPFWQTWWFVLLMLALLGGVSYIVYDNITTRRRRHQEQRRLQNAAEKLQLEHSALYAMMNPHFTFNALQSIQYFIHRQDKKAANKFLSSFAKLVRKNLESTKVDFISLSEEVERLKLYMSLEKMRFPEKFDFQVRIESGVDLSETQLPPMLLQPFVENSIKHGIMPLDEGGLITVDISQQDEEYLRILIQDNGIGVQASKERRANRPNDHVSRGMQITKDRLALFARITGREYSLDIFETRDENGNTQGTTVKLILPIREESLVA